MVVAIIAHVVPDGIMHPDVRPFAPVDETNPFHDVVSLIVLHWILIALGAIGAALIAFREARRS
jgi:hypothetical protein